jgi:hypothetical protein
VIPGEKTPQERKTQESVDSCRNMQPSQQSTHALEGAKHQVSTFYQSYDATTMEYMEHFKALVGVVETYASACRNELGLIKAQLITQGVVAADLTDSDPIKKKKALTVCHEEYLSCMILQGLDNTRFYQININLANSMCRAHGNDFYGYGGQVQIIWYLKITKVHIFKSI